MVATELTPEDVNGLKVSCARARPRRAARRRAPSPARAGSREDVKTHLCGDTSVGLQRSSSTGLSASSRPDARARSAAGHLPATRLRRAPIGR